MNIDGDNLNSNSRNQLIKEISTLDSGRLMAQYKTEKLLSAIFERDENNNAVIDYFRLLRFSFIFQFLPRDKQIVLNDEQKRKILELVASSKSLDPSELKTQLLQIDQNLDLPPDFNLQEQQIDALKILQAFENINNVFLNSLAFDYLGDTSKLCQMPVEKIKALATECDRLIQGINEEYKKIADYDDYLFYRIEPKLLSKITEFLQKIGRSKLFVSEVKERPDMGLLLQILIKFNTSANIALKLKPQNIANQNLKSAALEEIKKVLQSGIQI